MTPSRSRVKTEFPFFFSIEKSKIFIVPPSHLTSGDRGEWHFKSTHHVLLYNLACHGHHGNLASLLYSSNVLCGDKNDSLSFSTQKKITDVSK